MVSDVESTDAIRELLAARADVRIAYVFGSMAAGRAHAGSDVDVAVVFSVRPAPRVLDELVEELEHAAGRRVDLIDLAAAPPLLAHEVVKSGTVIVCRDDAERGEFEARTVLRYLDTAHLRRIQERYLRERAGRGR
jgi:predicted nucleotidyltransferase